MRPDQISVRAAPPVRDVFAQTVAGLGPPESSYPYALAALFAERPRVALDPLTARRTVLAHAYAKGHVRLEEDDSFTLTPHGERSLPSRDPGCPRFQRQGHAWRGDHLYPHARLRMLGRVDRAWKAPAYPGMARVVATDASVTAKGVGLGAVAEDGRWGMCSYYQRWLLPAQEENSNIAELRALALGLELLDPDHDGTLLTDSANAVAVVAGWRRGKPLTHAPVRLPEQFREQMLFPSLLSLEWLRTQLVERPHIRVQRVAGHSGHHLNEGADSLALMCRRALSTRTPFSHHLSGEALTERAHTLAGDLASLYREGT